MPLIIGTNKNEGLLIKVKHFSQELSKLTANEQILNLKENIFLDLKSDRKNYFSTNLNFLHYRASSSGTEVRKNFPQHFSSNSNSEPYCAKCKLENILKI